MAHQYSFKTEVVAGDRCYFSIDKGVAWIDGICTSVEANLIKEVIKLTFWVEDLPLEQEEVANRTDFLEWQSRLMDCARDAYKFKGNMDKMFGPESYSNWIPFYKEGLSVSNAYLIGIGIIDKEALQDDE
jgi:hypothetical protein